MLLVAYYDIIYNRMNKIPTLKCITFGKIDIKDTSIIRQARMAEWTKPRDLDVPTV